jgi:hypothetical protein
MSSLEQLLRRLRGSPESSDNTLAEVFPPERIAEIKRRELRQFKEAQDKKWRNWIESVSR